MPVPEPKKELKGHCSVIHSNTLYVFSEEAFQYIPLKEDAKWKTLDSGTAVKDAVCFLGGVDGNEDEEALYVVGGTGGGDDYPGIQRYSFKDKSWSILGGTGATDMTNRVGHGAAYLSSTSEIIVYSGSQSGDTTVSANSYVISAKPPYGISSKVSQGAPSSYQPMLMAWNSSDVAMMGGQQTSSDVWIYGDSTGWMQSGASLPGDILAGTTQPVLMDDSSGGKVLMAFKMDGSDNPVTSYALVNDDGEPQSPAAAIGAAKKRSMDDYPAYNSTGAPTKKWTDFAVAQQQGMAVISGGSGYDSLAIFNQTSNSWANATELFYGKPQHTLKHHTTTTSTSTSSTPTATSSTSASATPTNTTSSTPAAAAGGSTSHADLKTILGATLGSVCGVAVILLLLLFFLRRKKQQQIQSGQRPNDSKDRLSFQDQGIEPLADGAYPMAKSPVPVAAMSNDSLAIMSGHVTGEKSLRPPPPNAGYGLSSKPRDSSPLSPIPSSGLAPSSMYSQEAEGAAIVAGGAAGAAAGSNKPGDRTTDEGWGKYFEDNNDTSNLGMPADRSTVSSVYTKSDYRGSAWPMANLNPMNFGFLDQPKPLGHVYSGSPTTENPPSIGRSLAIPEAQSARISSADSISLASEDDPHDTAWTGAHKQSWLGRPPSSNYSTSFYNSSTRDLQNTSSGYFPNMMDNRQSNARRSSVIIPDDIDEIRTNGRDNANVNSDMSWLNIHADR